MAGGDLVMSAVERGRLVVISQVCLGLVSQRRAGERLGLCVGQVRRLVRAWRQRGDAGLVSRQRGRASNHRLADGLVDRIAALLKCENVPKTNPSFVSA